MHFKSINYNNRSFATSNTLFSLSLFSLLYLSDIKLTLGEMFDGAPIWILITIPILLIIFSFSKIGRVIAIKTIFISSLLLFIHLIVVHIFSDTPLDRSIVQIIFLSITLGLLYMGLNLISSPASALAMAVKIFLIIQFSATIVEVIINYNPGNQTYRHYFFPIWRESGLLREPSHVAVVMSIPLALLISNYGWWKRKLGLIPTACVLGIVILCPSTSMMTPFFVGLMLFFCRTSGRRAIGVAATFLALIVAAPLVVNLHLTNPVAERIFDTATLLGTGERSDSMNASAIVLAKGVYVMKHSILESPLGVGIDNLKYANDKFGFSFSHTFGSWNERDSASILIKILTEFGWLGAFISAFIFVFTLRIFIIGASEEERILSASAFALLTTNFIRGSGYFDFGFIFIIAIVLYEIRTQRIRRSHVNHTKALTPSGMVAYPRWIGKRPPPRTAARRALDSNPGINR